MKRFFPPRQNSHSRFNKEYADPARFQINTPNKPKVTKINALFISPSKFHIEEIKLSI
ncbi:hypothetical protein [Klebsiella pneumoniae IS39]|nr:hypothetical protein [Klebsiella pneumoniae IS39]